LFWAVSFNGILVLLMGVREYNTTGRTDLQAGCLLLHPRRVFLGLAFIVHFPCHVAPRFPMSSFKITLPTTLC
jgi:hypothetical protein